MTDEVDFIVVGAGSGGSAVAGRLSEDPGTSVAVLEAGGENDSWIVKTPAALVLMVASKINNWAFSTVPQKGLGGRRGYQPRGKGLGGSSAINVYPQSVLAHACQKTIAASPGSGWTIELRSGR